jgi:hypothetical protein
MPLANSADLRDTLTETVSAAMRDDDSYFEADAKRKRLAMELEMTRTACAEMMARLAEGTGCIQSLGVIALTEQDTDAARGHFAEGLMFYRRIPEPYSSGWTMRRLARMTEGATRTEHVDAARAAWESIKRPDLVDDLDAEFGAP